MKESTKTKIASIILLATIFVSLNGLRKPETKQVLSTKDKEDLKESTIQAKLTEVYEKQKNITFNENFVPRYSVYENQILGFRLSYPVGFNVTTTEKGVKIAPDNNHGAINVIVENKQFKLEVINSSTSENEAVALTSAGDFIKSTFQFIDTRTYSKTDMQKRFSQNNENVGIY